MTVALSEDRIKDIIRHQALWIKSSYANVGVQDLWVYPVMNGAIHYASDLFREIANVGGPMLRYFPQHLCKFTGQNEGTENPDIKDQHILIVDTIFDTGMTAHELYHEFRDRRGAKVSFAHLCHKQGLDPLVFWTQYAGLPVKREMYPSVFTGAMIPDEFVWGYGLDNADHNGTRREWPFIAYEQKES